MTHPAPAPGVPAAGEPLVLPVTAVTCLEDRAQVERSGDVRLAAGVTRLRVGPVTALAVDRSLRAEITGTGDAPAAARVVDARVLRVYAPAPPGEPGPDASRPAHDVEALGREVLAAERHRTRLESRLAVISQARADLHRDIVQGAGNGDADPERWTDRLERIDTEEESRTGELDTLDHRLKDLRAQLAEARDTLAATGGKPRALTAWAEVVVETDRAGEARLNLLHLVPCALWRPAYRATLAADRASVLVETEAFVWQDTGEDWKDVRLSLSTARPTLAAEPPRLTEDVLSVRDRTAQERQSVAVHLREQDIPTTGSSGTAAGELPGLHDGGEVRLLTAPHPVTVPSGRQPQRVPLTSFTTACRTEEVCAPELSPAAVTTAAFRNEAGHVLLAGPVDLVRGGGFTGRTRLDFAAAGEEIRLAFGGDDTVRVVRHTTETRDTAGLTGINQRTVITHEVRLFVSRLDAAPDAGERAVTVRERVPVSEISAVEARIRAAECRPAPEGPDAEGVVSWRLLLEPGARRELVLVHELVAGSAVVGL